MITRPQVQRRRASAENSDLDLMINNAAVADLGGGPPSKVKTSTLESAMHTNYIGTVAVTQAMLPLLRTVARAQIINVSSEIGSSSLHSDTNWKYAPVKFLGYCAQKPR